MQTHKDTAIDASVLSLLRIIPTAWGALPADKLTHAQEKALVALVCAGMVERRLTIRLRMHGDNTALKGTIVMTGESGLEQAVDQIAAAGFPRWEMEWKRHKEGPGREAPKFFCELVGIGEWRLTGSGVDAKADASSGGEQAVLDWVFMRGCFDGRMRLREDGSTFQRTHIAGEGRLESLEFENIGPSNDPQPDVRVTNWEEGAALISKSVVGAMRAETSPPPIRAETFSPADIWRALKTTDTTLGKYAGIAKVRRPGRGGRNHRYTREECQRILLAITSGPGDIELKDRARSLFARFGTGAQTQEKSKKPN